MIFDCLMSLFVLKSNFVIFGNIIRQIYVEMDFLPTKLELGNPRVQSVDSALQGCNVVDLAAHFDADNLNLI